MHPEITPCYVNNYHDLTSYLSGQFPSSSAEDVHDALSDAYLEACKLPERFEEAWQAGGCDQVLWLFRCVAWRLLRARYRRKANRMEQIVGDLTNCDQLVQPGQLYAACLGERVDALLEEAALRFGHQRSQALRQALEHKFRTGESDRRVAHAFGIPREYLNRAKHHVLGELLLT